MFLPWVYAPLPGFPKVNTKVMKVLTKCGFRVYPPNVQICFSSLVKIFD